VTMPMGSSVAGIVAARALRVDRKIVQRLRKAGATSTTRAIHLDPMTPFQRRRLLRLERHGVVRMGAPERWFLDEEAWVGLQRTRRWNAFAAITLMVVTLLVLIWWSTRAR